MKAREEEVVQYLLGLARVERNVCSCSKYCFFACSKKAHSGSKTISLQETKTLQTMVELATFLTLQPGQTEVGMWGLKSGIQAVTGQKAGNPR